MTTEQAARKRAVSAATTEAMRVYDEQVGRPVLRTQATKPNGSATLTKKMILDILGLTSDELDRALIISGLKKIKTDNNVKSPNILISDEQATRANDLRASNEQANRVSAEFQQMIRNSPRYVPPTAPILLAKNTVTVSDSAK